MTEELAAFVSGPVLMTIGTRDAANRPMIARGTGGRAWDDRGGISLAISGWLWPETVANLRANGMISATFVRPDTYEAFQLKGRARLRDPEPSEREAGGRYVREAAAMLNRLEIPLALIACWLTDRDLVIADFTVDRVFEQTPGPRAGRVVA
nr:pyridoxamine 5'-phosphate oxidase family protein [Amaricoccus solimangrovi]